MNPRVHVIGAATSAGAHGPGQERAPQAFRDHGLLDRLHRTGAEVVDHGGVVHAVMTPDPEHPRLANLEAVVAAAQAVSAAVRRVLESDSDGLLVVLGGDCTIQLGVMAAARAVVDGSVGLAYIDLDCDLTSPAEGNGIADWMGVTHLLDAPDADPRLAGVGEVRPLATPQTLRLVAADLATAYEARRLEELGLTRYRSSQVTADTEGVLGELWDWADGMDLLSVHVDVDVLDQTLFPIAEERRSTPGLDLATVSELVTGLMSHPAARVLTICEVNPDRPPEPHVAFAALIDVIASAIATTRDRRSVRQPPGPPGA